MPCRWMDLYSPTPIWGHKTAGRGSGISGREAIEDVGYERVGVGRRAWVGSREMEPLWGLVEEEESVVKKETGVAERKRGTRRVEDHRKQDKRRESDYDQPVRFGHLLIRVRTETVAGGGHSVEGFGQCWEEEPGHWVLTNGGTKPSVDDSSEKVGCEWKGSGEGVGEKVL